MKKVQELNPSINELLNLDYNYQTELTEQLDNINTDFNQEIINEIVLWKINRYAKLTNETLFLINQIDVKSKVIDTDLIEEIINHLLNTKGVLLPMASTILRFRNPTIYQIIDQRVYRIIYGIELKLKTKIKDNVNQYLNYLTDLKKVCDLYQISFSESDRIANSEKIKY